MMTLTASQIVADLQGFIRPDYPHMEIQAAPWEDDPSRLAIKFTDAKFSLLYPYQRWHYLVHLIPAAYHAQHLETSIWFELAPGEAPDDLRYHDEDVVQEITPIIMRILEKIGFFQQLDDLLCPVDRQLDRAECWGDFRHSKQLLRRIGMTDDEQFDIFHVLMFQGGFCDCEILYNVSEENRLKAEYWKARAAGLDPPDAHHRS